MIEERTEACGGTGASNWFAKLDHAIARAAKAAIGMMSGWMAQSLWCSVRRWPWPVGKAALLVVVVTVSARGAFGQSLSVYAREGFFGATGCSFSDTRVIGSSLATQQLDWLANIGGACGTIGSVSARLFLSSPNASPKSFQVEMSGESHSLGNGSANAQVMDVLYFTLSERSRFRLRGSAFNLNASNEGLVQLRRESTTAGFVAVIGQGPGLIVQPIQIQIIGEGPFELNGTMLAGNYRLSVTGGGAATCGPSSPACTTDANFSRTTILELLCQADLSDDSSSGTPDGGVDINDLLFFLSAFEAGSTAVDLDNGSGTGTPDGGVDIADLLFFLARFEAGC